MKTYIDPKIAHNILESKVLYLLLIMSGKYSFLPDLFDALDNNVETMSKVLAMFAGVTIQFPTLATLERYTRDIKIYLELEHKNGKKAKSIVDKLAIDHDISEEVVKSAYKKMQQAFLELGIKI